ncbi:MAG: heavy-metal-associated domain-containing protein [Bacteroidetes bacterium]|jgi:mercuric ion binding protein|nr:heavy-metal-associated domain-containing protein [Bacteroidota bacterium]
MKTSQYILIAFIALAITSCGNKAESETVETSTVVANGLANSTFKVWGNCEMCKETIEGSLKVEGVTKADWSTETKMISVTYDTTKITLDQIQKNIALVGYDNENYKGDDKTYSELPECCQYDRKP